jgi:predicted Zn-ribbon and HTH transcriptional regulator
MHTTPGDFDRLQGVLADADEPLTAREIYERLDTGDDEAFENPHQVATVLGRRAREGEITVIAEQPYQYEISDA